MQAYILGIDIGTGSTKAVAVSLTGEILGMAQHKYGISSTESGASEQDPEQIWQAFIQSVYGVVKHIGYNPQAIGFSTAMHSLIPVDQQGLALAPMMTWADTRSAYVAERIGNSAEAENIYRLSGTPIHPMSPLCKLIWLRENKNSLFNTAYKFVSIKSYLWFKLFGVFEVDYSIACGDGLFDIVNFNWSETICTFAGINAAQLASPVDTTYSRNDINPAIAHLLGISVSTPVVIGASDGCCANLGSDATAPGVAALTIGSSGAVRMGSKTPIYNYPAMTFNYYLRRETFICGGAANNGGLAVDWMLRNFLGKTNLSSADYDELFQQIEEMPAGSDGLMFLPYLYGERAPIWDARSSGAFINVKFNHTRPHFLRAGLEGVCYALYDVLQMLEQSAGEITQVNVSGGFVSSAVWLQLLADLLGKPLKLVNAEDASAIGAAYLAAEGAGLHLVSASSQSNPDELIVPDTKKHQVYRRYFPLFQKLYADLKDTMHSFYHLTN